MSQRLGALAPHRVGASASWGSCLDTAQSTPFPQPMNTPTENDPDSTNANEAEASEADASGADARDTDAHEGGGSERASGAGRPEVSRRPGGPPGGPPRGPARRPVTSEEWHRLRAPFSRDAYIVDTRATGRAAANLPLKAYSEDSGGSKSGESKSGGSGPKGESSGQNVNQSVVDLRLRPEAIRDRLDLVLGPGRYGYRLEPGPEAGGTFSMRCHLRVGFGRRTGIGTASSPRMAGRVALASAAEAFGMGASGKLSGPIIAGHESRRQLPGPVLDRLERREDPSSWTPGSKRSESGGQS